VGRGEPDCPLTKAWEVVRRPSDGGEGSGGQNFGAGHAQARRVGNGGGDECGEEGVSSSPFYKGQGGLEASEWGGDQSTAVVMAINGHLVEWGGKTEGLSGTERGGGSAVPFVGEEGTQGRCTCALEAAPAAAPLVA
jgi:hypothetical protein